MISNVVKRLQKCVKGEHKFGVALATQSVNIVMLILQITGHYQEVGEDLVTDLQEEVIISGCHWDQTFALDTRWLHNKI